MSRNCHPPVSLIARGMDQYEQGDLAGLREHVHEDAEIQVVLRLVTYFRSALQPK